jgi:hypothetical protein
MPSIANNYLEVLVNDEDVTLEELNHLCGTKHDIFTRARIPRRCLPMESTKEEVVDDHGVGHVDVDKNPIARSKILTHFIKGKFSLSPMETILVILGELESLESLVKFAKKNHDENLKSINLTKVEGLVVVRRISVNKNHHNKTLHLLVEISNHLVEGLVDTWASMSVMSADVVGELGIIHLVFGSKS